MTIHYPSGVANLRKLQKESTRSRLLATALELFERNGFAATTVDDIAAAAGTTRATFYAHFESRRELMRALFDELNRLLERVTSAEHGSSARPLVEAVQLGTREAIEAWLRAQAARWPVIKPYILAATEASAIDPEIRLLMNEWFDETISDIVEGLTRADRYEPETRRFRGELAIAQLDHTALHWMREAWDLDGDRALAVLAESWAKLLGP
jgi:AcrR family transcriptional regulator